MESNCKTHEYLISMRLPRFLDKPNFTLEMELVWKFSYNWNSIFNIFNRAIYMQFI